MSTQGDEVTTPSANRKSRLRQGALAARRERPDEERAEASATIAAAVAERVRELGAAVIAAYIPIGAEPGSMGALDALSVRSTVIVPVVRPDRDLDWAAWTGGDDLVPSGPSGRMLRPIGPTLGVGFIEGADMVLAPALLVAQDGTRLGRGGGSYDRALRRVRPGIPVAAPLYDGEVVPQLPRDPWDVPVTAAVTPGAGWTDLRG